MLLQELRLGWLSRFPAGVLWLLTILFPLLIWTVDAQTLPLERIKLPPGFEISLYASGVENARSMTLSPNGTVFVGTRSAGKVYAVVDRNGDAKADEVITLARGLNSPNGGGVSGWRALRRGNQPGVTLR